MTVEPIHTPQAMPKPARTPAAIRAVLVNAAEPGLVERFDTALDRAYGEARDADSIEPLNEMLKWWWAESVSWCDPAGHRAFLAEVEGYRINGIPPEKRISTQEVLRALEAEHGKGAMGPVWDRLAGRV